MAKNVVKKIKLQIPAGKATPAPPVGTVLGPAGINLQEFCTKYNDATREKMGDIIPVEISIYEDRTFDFVLKTPPTASLLLKAAGISKGSKKGANEIVATISKDDIKKVAEIKMPDLNCYDLEKAIQIVAGTARNMGIAVKGLNDGELAEQAVLASEAAAQAAKLEADLEAMEESAKAMAEGASVEVETTAQSKETENEDEE
ncbi:MAG: 50S ribosomal protein L11 [Bacilli bacterium]